MIVWIGLAAAAVVEGRVYERGTGDPIAEVTLRFAGQEVVAARDGSFSVDLPPGTPVDFLAGGYQAQTENAPETGPWKVYLRRSNGTMEVVVEARRDSPVVAEQHLDRERVLETPGTHEDPIRLLQSLPSVTQTPEYAPTSGDIAVRGGEPGDNRFYLDGVEIPYLYHYNQYSSVFHTRLLDELTLYPSTFGSNFGNAIGAVVDTRSTWTHPARPHGSVNLNLIMGGASAEIPVGKDWTIRASGRRSYLDLISSSSLQYTVFPTFYDWFGRVERVKGSTQLGMMTFGAGDAYDRYAGEPTLLDAWEQTENPVFSYRQNFQVYAFQHATRVEGASLIGSASFTLHRLDGDLPAAYAHTLDDIGYLREDGTLDIGDHLELAGGGELRVARTTLDVSTTQAWAEVTDETPLLGRGLSTAETLDRITGGLYVEPRLEFGPVRVLPGARLDVDSLAGTAVVDPRLGVRWHIAPDTHLRAAAGFYSQFPEVEIYSAVLGAPDAGPIRSRQVAFGFDQAIAGRWEMGLDGWSRWMSDLVVTEPGVAPITGVTGTAQGVSVATRYRLREVFFASASLDLSRSTRTVAGVTAPSDFDQPFAVNVVGSWTFVPTWNVGLRYRLSAGLPYTSIEDGLYDAAQDRYLPVYGVVNGARLPSYQKVDLHVEKRIELRTISITPYLEAWYVPKASNVLYLAWSYDYDATEPVRGPGFLPLVGARGEI